MVYVIATVHIVVCLLLIGLVLLQDPKSSGTGGVFGGGGSNSLLGATGAVTFLTRLTRYSAIIFGVTCLALTLFSRPQGTSVIDTLPATSRTAPAAPAQTNGAAPAAPAEGAAPAAPGAAAPAAPAPAEPAAPAQTK